MKTLKELEEKLLTEVNLVNKWDNKAGKAISKENAKIAQLKQGIIYLKDFNPTEEQVRRQYDKLMNDMLILENRREEWCINHNQHMSLNGVNTKNRKEVDAYYNKLHDITKKRNQAKFLEFILSK